MSITPLTLAFALLAGAPAEAQPPLPNPFYAMDTCTKRPYPKNDIPPARQFDLLKELGYAGVAWTEEAPEQVSAAVADAEARGLKMFAIYCNATVDAEGRLAFSPLVEPIIKTLRGHDTLIWLHIGGKGPAVSTLKEDAPAVRQLRDLAAKAEASGLKVALYPHVGDWTERVLDAVHLASLVNRMNFGVTFNLCHCLAMGDEANVPKILEEAAPYLMTVTINGADSGVKGPDWKRLIQTLDRGSYDVGVVLRSLEKVGFEGPVGLQGYGLGGDRRDNLARSMKAWRALATEQTGAKRP